MSIRVDGIGSLINDIDAMVSSADPTGALEAGAAILLAQMQMNAASDPRVISGKLHGALGIQLHGGRNVTVGVHRKDWSGGDDYYPAYVEYGHGGPHPAPPHPYIRPAVDAKAGAAMDVITELLRAALGK